MPSDWDFTKKRREGKCFMIEKNKIDPFEKEMIDDYCTLHQSPELGLAEYKTSAFIEQKLQKWGIPYVSGVARTGVIGTITGKKPGKTVALRADMDALPITESTGLPYASQTPGKMHACGHDAHVAMLLGAAQYFSLHQDELCGTVKLIFQPAEEDNDPTAVPLGEVPGGAYYIIQDGHLRDVDYCLAIHMDPSLPVGSVKIHKKEAMAATDLFRVSLIGKGGHGGAPHQAVDVIPPLAELLSALNTVIPREISPFSPAVLTIGTVNTVASVWNATPGQVDISGTFRTYDEKTRAHIARRIDELSAAIATAHHCKAVYEREIGYSPTVNDERISRFLAKNMESFLGEGHVISNPEPLAGGEDVGFYLKQVPGAMMFMGCSDPGKTGYADLHNPSFTVDLRALAYGTLIHVNNVLALLEADPQ